MNSATTTGRGPKPSAGTASASTAAGGNVWPIVASTLKMAVEIGAPPGASRKSPGRCRRWSPPPLAAADDAEMRDK